ncbi:VanW family protein [Deinococcus radiophilus]|uniref:VanW family protein n=1 Tax=Deinococcus radiophilus TaxID=32062 RepID=UPI001E31BE5E|nr:VanW family protein [Deinococcus radiophilus]UFA49758.1 VanW family protein [Deinococcus radiophilus]
MMCTRTLVSAALLMGGATALAQSGTTAIQLPAQVFSPSAPTPATQQTLTAPAQPLVLRFQADVPAYVAGQKTKVRVTKEMNIPAGRAQIIRQRGTVTQSLEQGLTRWMTELNAGGGARFEKQQGGGWVLVQHDLFKLDADATRAALLAAIKDPSIQVAQAKVAAQSHPQRTLDYFISRGITGHLGTGNTNYKGSSKARMTNIHVGASKFKDRLFEGGTFSFNQFLGPISRGNGYVDGLIIAGDRTEEGLGGGICQVSTTVFRSLYMAGLPVRERHTHSYQVSYYKPQGLDAAIYQPTLDLKFANDTGGAIWFQTDWNDETGEFNVYSFGKPRDFQVKLSEPRVIKSTPAPADRTIQTDTLASGQRKQVDWAAPGGTLEVDRLFVRNGQTFKKETLTSNYRAWPNIFLVGR